jgi:HSP20 family protein
LADLPGVKEGDVEVTLDHHLLKIEGRVATELYEGLAPLYTEYNVGHYYREFMLNENIDANKIRARMKNGLLEVELPKVEKTQPRRIELDVN